MTEREQLEEIYEALVGDNGIVRYEHDELLAFIADLTISNAQPLSTGYSTIQPSVVTPYLG